MYRGILASYINVFDILDAHHIISDLQYEGTGVHLTKLPVSVCILLGCGIDKMYL